MSELKEKIFKKMKKYTLLCRLQGYAVPYRVFHDEHAAA